MGRLPSWGFAVVPWGYVEFGYDVTRWKYLNVFSGGVTEFWVSDVGGLTRGVFLHFIPTLCAGSFKGTRTFEVS